MLSASALGERASEFLDGRAALSVFQSWNALLQADPESDLWDPTGCTRANFGSTATMLLIVMCEFWKRMIHARNRYPYSLFSLVSMSDEAAKQELDRIEAHTCDMCLYKPFTSAVIRSYVSHHRTVVAASAIRVALRDTLLTAPVTSERVERLHANIQVKQRVKQNAGRIPPIVQRETYVTLARIQQRRLKDHMERYVFGKATNRAKRLMRERRVCTAAPADNSLRNKVRKPATIKRKPPKTSTWNAFMTRRNEHGPRTNTELATEYRQIMNTDDGRRRLKDAAATLQAARNELAEQPLGILSVLADASFDFMVPSLCLQTCFNWFSLTDIRFF